MIERVQITVLANNEAAPPLLAEYGLSMWIDTGEMRILFDTGQGNTLLRNAEQLEVPLELADYIVLSHGHYDHSGGLADVLQVAKTARLVLASGAFVKRYSIPPGKKARSIGMPLSSLLAIEHLSPERIIKVDGPILLSEGVGLTGPISRENDFEDEGGPFFFDPEGIQRDQITDDQALWLSTKKGLIVCFGCGHSGIVNTLRMALSQSKLSDIHAIIGGFHLLQASDYRLQMTFAALRSIAPRCIFPCHCTGEIAVKDFLIAFGKDVVAIPTAGFRWSSAD